MRDFTDRHGETYTSLHLTEEDIRTLQCVTNTCCCYESSVIHMSSYGEQATNHKVSSDCSTKLPHLLVQT